MGMMTSSNEGQYLTPDELTVRWKNAISLGTLANWRSRKCGPGFTRIGGRVLYPLEAVIAWEAKNHVTNGNGK